MKKNQGQIKRIMKHNAGTTMVEVLVAFLVVVLMTAMFAKVVSVSVQMLNGSQKLIHKTEKFDEEFYKTDASTKMVPVNDKISLVPDKNKTDKKNGQKDVNLELSKQTYQKFESNGLVRYTFAKQEQESPGK